MLSNDSSYTAKRMYAWHLLFSGFHTVPYDLPLSYKTYRYPIRLLWLAESNSMASYLFYYATIFLHQSFANSSFISCMLRISPLQTVVLSCMLRISPLQTVVLSCILRRNTPVSRKSHNSTIDFIGNQIKVVFHGQGISMGDKDSKEIHMRQRYTYERYIRE